MAYRIWAFFKNNKKAQEAANELQAKGINTVIDPNPPNMHNPDHSVSKLMVGFLPDLSQGLFGSSGVFLLAVAHDRERLQEVKGILEDMGGEIRSG